LQNVVLPEAILPQQIITLAIFVIP